MYESLTISFHSFTRIVGVPGKQLTNYTSLSLSSLYGKASLLF